MDFQEITVRSQRCAETPHRAMADVLPCRVCGELAWLDVALRTELSTVHPGASIVVQCVHCAMGPGRPVASMMLTSQLDEMLATYPPDKVAQVLALHATSAGGSMTEVHRALQEDAEGPLACVFRHHLKQASQLVYTRMGRN